MTAVIGSANLKPGPFSEPVFRKLKVLIVADLRARKYTLRDLALTRNLWA